MESFVMPGRNRLHVKFWGLHLNTKDVFAIGGAAIAPRMMTSSSITKPLCRFFRTASACSWAASCPVVAASGNQANAFAVALKAHASGALLRGHYNSEAVAECD